MTSDSSWISKASIWPSNSLTLNQIKKEKLTFLWVYQNSMKLYKKYLYAADYFKSASKKSWNRTTIWFICIKKIKFMIFFKIIFEIGKFITRVFWPTLFNIFWSTLTGALWSDLLIGLCIKSDGLCHSLQKCLTDVSRYS